MIYLPPSLPPINFTKSIAITRRHTQLAPPFPSKTTPNAAHPRNPCQAILCCLIALSNQINNSEVCVGWGQKKNKKINCCSFSAESEREKQEWIEAVKESIAETLYDYEVAEKIWFKEANRSCADCRAPQPEWASVNLGVVICKKCAGKEHRYASLLLVQKHMLDGGGHAADNKHNVHECFSESQFCANESRPSTGLI